MKKYSDVLTEEKSGLPKGVMTIIRLTEDGREEILGKDFHSLDDVDINNLIIDWKLQ